MIKDILTYIDYLKIAHMVRNTERYKAVFEAQQNHHRTIKDSQRDLKNISAFLPLFQTKAKAKRAISTAKAELEQIEISAVHINEYIDSNPEWRIAIHEVYPSLHQLKYIAISYILTLLTLIICAKDFTIPQTILAFTIQHFAYIGIFFIFFKRFKFKNVITKSDNK